MKELLCPLVPIPIILILSNNAATSCRTATPLTSSAPIILATIGQVAVIVKRLGQA